MAGSAEEMRLVADYARLCEGTGYFSSYCFDRAVVSYCDSTKHYRKSKAMKP